MIDMLGFGFSEKPQQGHYTLFEQADLIEEVLCQLGVHNYHLVAHDYGAKVAVELLARSQYGQSRQSVLSASFIGPVSFIDAANKRTRLSLLLPPLQGWVKRMLYRKRVRAIADPMGYPFREWEQGWQAVKFDSGVQTLSRLLTCVRERQYYQARWSRALIQNNTPVCLLAGAQRNRRSCDVESWLRSISRSLVVKTIADSGDFPHLERPLQVGEELCRFYQMLAEGHHWLTRRAAV